MKRPLHLLIFGQKQARQNGHDEDHGHAVVGKDALHELREDGEDVAHLRKPDADGQRQRGDGDVALGEAGIGDHLEAAGR